MDRHIYKLIDHDVRMSLEFKDCVKVIIFKQSKAWQAEVQNEAIEKYAKQFKITVWEYRDKLKDYIINTPENVEFKFEKNEFIIYCNAQNSMKVKYFSCTLEKTNFADPVLDLLDKFYRERTKYYAKFIELEKSQKELVESKTMYENKLTEFVERKRNNEQELYNNFVMVLNEKKQEIQHLFELLEAFRRGRPTVNPPAPVRNRKTKALKTEIDIKKEEVSDSDSTNSNSEQEYNTDDEKEKERLDDIDLDENLLDDAKPSTSKAVLDICLDDSPPPRRLLPKRIKRRNSDEITDVTVHSPPKVDKVEPRSPKSTETESKINTANCDTQDLLDFV